MGKAVDRTEVRVMFLRIRDDMAAISAGWDRLESIVPVHGRTFYGAFFPETKEYWVCTQVKDGDDASSLGLEEGNLPGGRFLLMKLKGEPPEVYERIAPTFDSMMKDAAVDGSRPGIEFYRRRDEIDLLLPITTG